MHSRTAYPGRHCLAAIDDDFSRGRAQSLEDSELLGRRNHMAGRMWTAVALVALGFASGAGWDALGQSKPRNFQHRGQVIESDSMRPLQVSVKAWAQSTRTGMDGKCPVFGTGPLDTVTSDGGSGMF